MYLEPNEGGGYKAGGDAVQYLVDKMKEGNPNCTYKIGDKVMKSNSEEGDKTPDGTTGEITGSYQMGEMNCYLVIFEGNDLPAFIIETKLSLL